MRQVVVCGWLLASLVVAACSGEQFTTSGDSPTGNSPPAADLAGGSQGGGGSSTKTGGSPSAGRVGSGSGGTIGSAGGGVNPGPRPGGGASSAGSPSSSGGDAAEACASGSVTFRMLPGASLNEGFLCDAGCGSGWLTLTDAAGTTAFSISSACGTASCETCEVQVCGAAACLPTPLTARGSELTWRGTYLAKDTCGDNMACQRQACVKPGRYKARACAALNQGQNTSGACMPQESQLCAEAEFDFPGSTTVELRLEK